MTSERNLLKTLNSQTINLYLFTFIRNRIVPNDSRIALDLLWVGLVWPFKAKIARNFKGLSVYIAIKNKNPALVFFSSENENDSMAVHGLRLP